MNEFEVFEKYEKSEQVINLVKLINGETKCAEKTHDAAVLATYQKLQKPLCVRLE